MKKKLVASLAAAMVLSVASTSFASTNPFVDVPAKHWAYDSVNKLAQSGIIDGYGDGTYRGDKLISRYEMAQMVAKAMARSDKADAAQKAEIDRLAVEFSSELEGLNVRVTKIEKNASTVKVTGEARLRYEDYSSNGASENLGSNNFKLRTRIGLTGNINDDWIYYGRLQSINSLRGDKGSDNNNVTMDNAYVKGAIGGTTATVGRFDYFLNSGLMIDSTLNGVNLAFGNVLKANVFYGTDNNKDLWDNNNLKADLSNLEVTGLGLNYATSKATTLNGGYYQFKDKDRTATFAGSFGDNKAKVWEAGFSTQFSPDWNLRGSYGKSDANTDNKAYYAQFGYKGAEQTKVGSYGAWVGYRHLGANASPKTTIDGPYTVNGQQGFGAKGYEVGFNYTPVLNTVLQVKYADLKATTDGAPTDKTKYIQAQAEFFF